MTTPDLRPGLYDRILERVETEVDAINAKAGRPKAPAHHWAFRAIWARATFETTDALLRRFHDVQESGGTPDQICAVLAKTLIELSDASEGVLRATKVIHHAKARKPEGGKHE
jgi:hypothetical protein